jgi:hypothetical protein
MGEVAIPEFLSLWLQLVTSISKPTERMFWCGDGRMMVCTRLSQHMMASLLAKLALHTGASSLFGWSQGTVVGLPTDCNVVACGLPHPEACPFCDQELETVRHLLLGCVVATPGVDVRTLAMGQAGLVAH